jgi:hypothetical protein
MELEHLRDPTAAVAWLQKLRRNLSTTEDTEDRRFEPKEIVVARYFAARFNEAVAG